MRVESAVDNARERVDTAVHGREVHVKSRYGLVCRSTTILLHHGSTERLVVVAP